MNSLKKFSYLILLLTSSVLGYANSVTNICLTGRIVKNIPSYGEAFINAAYLAKENSGLASQVNIKTFYYDDTPLAPIDTYQKMLKSRCAAIIGFEYLSDLLLIKKIQKSTTIPIFTSYASTLNDSSLANNIFISQPSYSFFSHKMLTFLQNRHKNLNNVLVITEINRDSMKEYREAYINEFKKMHIKYTDFYFLENDQDIENKLSHFLENKKRFQYVFLLSGAIGSAKIANIMNDHKTVFIGTENYGSEVSPSFYLLLKDKKINSYFIRNLSFLRENNQLRQFRSNYQNKYHALPPLLSAYTYDATMIISNVIKMGKWPDANTILNANYKGVTGITLANRHFYRSREYIILKVTPNGYKYEE